MSVRQKNLTELFEIFISDQTHVTRRSWQTIRGYRCSFELFLKIVPHASIGNVQDPEIMSQFFTILETRERTVGRGTIVRGVKKSTTRTYFSKLQRFFRWLHEQGHISQNPFARLQAPNVQYVDRMYLKKEEVHQIFDACRFGIKWENDFVRDRNYVILMVLLNCGLRRGELIGLQMGDLDLQRRLLTVRAETSKSQTSRVIPINEELYEALKMYLAHREKRNVIGSSTALFLAYRDNEGLSKHGLKHLMEKLDKASGVDFHPHQFRHTFAINLLTQKVDVAKLKQLMGHKDIRMTAVYLRQIPTDAMRVDLERLSLGSLV